MVLESELRRNVKEADAVDGDFHKLVQARADVRVWISTSPGRARLHIDNCKKQIQEFDGTQPGDCYIFLLFTIGELKRRLLRALYSYRTRPPCQEIRNRALIGDRLQVAGRVAGLHLLLEARLTDIDLRASSHRQRYVSRYQLGHPGVAPSPRGPAHYDGNDVLLFAMN
jgi:hypothetical protein